MTRYVKVINPPLRNNAAAPGPADLGSFKAATLAKVLENRKIPAARSTKSPINISPIIDRKRVHLAIERRKPLVAGSRCKLGDSD